MCACTWFRQLRLGRWTTSNKTPLCSSTRSGSRLAVKVRVRREISLPRIRRTCVTVQSTSVPGGHLLALHHPLALPSLHLFLPLYLALLPLGLGQPVLLLVPENIFSINLLNLMITVQIKWFKI